MTPQAALAAITTNDSAEAPRLVFADLLSDRGDPHGEFIVVQCELARLEREGDTKSAAYHQLKARERAAELQLRQLRLPWWDAGLVWRKFDRGFVTRLEVRRAEAVELMSQLQEDPLFAAVTRIELAEGTPLAVQHLTRLTGFAELQTLRIARKYASHAMGEDGARKLGQWPVMQHVTDLRLRNEQIDEVALALLVTSPYLSSLRRLSIGNNSAGVSQALLAEPWPRLTELELSSCRLTPDEVQTLVTMPALRGLKGLALSANHVGDDGAKVIASSPLALNELDLGYTGLTDNGVMALVNAPNHSFTKLVLTSADVGPSILRLAKKHRGLKVLMLNETQVDDQHVVALCNSLNGSLERLSLRGTPVTVTSVEALKHCGHLRFLSLARTEIGNAGAEVLAGNPHFASLEQLDLDSCHIDADGCLTLLNSPYLSRTLDLSLTTNGLPESVLSALRARFKLA